MANKIKAFFIRWQNRFICVVKFVWNFNLKCAWDCLVWVFRKVRGF